MKVDWERWIGIRGAAVLGAVVLGLAGLLFFKYSIDRGLITPTMRAVFGTVVGLACVVGSEWLRRMGYRYLAEGVSGAGVVILYSAFWAAHILYGLIGMPAAFGLMILVTAACCVLAVRHSAFVVAVIGLIGGFATPLLLSSGSDRPIGLFGYVLLLDLALLTLGHKKRWPSLGALSLLATVLIQALWIGARMGPDRVLLGLVILGTFAALFAWTARLAPEGAARRVALWSQVGAILFPFAFAVYFAARVDLGPHLYPLAILMALLGGAACWISRERGRSALGLGAAAATVAVIGVWLLQHRLTPALSWETVAVGVGLSVVFHLFLERDRASFAPDDPALAALVSAAGVFILFLFAGCTAESAAPWPWVAGWAVLTALLYRQAGFPGQGELQVAAAVGLGVALSALHLVRHAAPGFPAATPFLALLVGGSVAIQGVALSRRQIGPRRLADVASVVLPVVLLVGLAVAPMMRELGPAPALGATLLLGLLAALGATRLGSGIGYAAAAAATWIAQVSWTAQDADRRYRAIEHVTTDLAQRPSDSLHALILEALAVVAFTAWPFVAASRFSSQRAAWYAAALSAPAWFFSLRQLFVAAFGDAFIGALPVALGALALAATARARRHWASQDPLRLSALAWFSAVALGFISVAIPLQLEKEWITIGWALEGLAVIALWRRLDHPGLKYFGVVLLGAAAARLVANPFILDYYTRSGTRIFNWLLYTYVVPAAAALGSAALLRPLETGRLRAWERQFYQRDRPLGSISVAVAALLVVFVWINLTIADWFSTGPTLTLSFGETPAQRLTVSIAWAVYALVLLGFGMARDTIGLRWLSLGFLLVTIGKVFLYDLGALRDLYRVASLAGLAVSLLLVSFLYQRFVFRRAKAGAP